MSAVSTKMAMQLITTVAILAAAWPLSARKYEAGEYLYYRTPVKSGGESVVATVTADTPDTAEWIPIELPATAGGRRTQVRSAWVLPLELGKNATLLECQLELLSEWSRTNPRSRRLSALLEVVSMRPADERSRRIIQLMKFVQHYQRQLPPLLQELAWKRSIIQSLPSPANATSPDQRKLVETEIEPLLARLDQMDDDVDTVLSKTLVQKEFWMALPLVRQIHRLLMQQARSLPWEDFGKVQGKCRQREETLLSAFSVCQEQWRQDSLVTRFLTDFPDARGTWRQNPPQTIGQLYQRLDRACRAWRKLPEISVMAEPEAWGSTVLEVLTLLPPGTHPPELYEYLQKELAAPPAKDAGGSARRTP